MAGGAVAHLDDVLALGLQGEVLIEGGHTVYLGHPYPQLLRDALQHRGAEILVLRLDVLHDGDQVVQLTAVAINDLLHPLHGYSIGHGFLSFRRRLRGGPICLPF